MNAFCIGRQRALTPLENDISECLVFPIVELDEDTFQKALNILNAGGFDSRTSSMSVPNLKKNGSGLKSIRSVVLR